MGHGGSGLCAPRLPPDRVVSSRLPRLAKAPPYVPVRLPSSFGASSEQVLGELILERLERVMPETETQTALKYLEDASFALSLCRSFQGITASGHRELVPTFDAVISGPLPKAEAEALRGILAAEEEAALGDSGAGGKALRVKGAYHLVAAAALRQRRFGPTPTA